MYEISVAQDFDAAHFLRGYGGKCEKVHGHSFRVVVKIRASELNDIGIAYDFADLKKHLRDILARYDHTCLNDIEPFGRINPSSENIASAIFGELKNRLGGISLYEVEVWESPQSRVTFRPD